MRFTVKVLLENGFYILEYVEIYVQVLKIVMASLVVILLFLLPSMSACPENTFGNTCEGTCRCLFASDCNKINGECSQCALGWSGLPMCQTPCRNFTFGSDCVYLCHCPPNDSCSSINGICNGGACAEGWSSAGCQNELPQLSDPPSVENVTCANVTIVWQGWKKGVDRGNTAAMIRNYEVFFTYSLSPNITDSIWTLMSTVNHSADQDTYRTISSTLIPNAYYRYRIDVRQMDGSKPMPVTMKGKTSTSVQIPCTEISTTTTPLTTTTPQPGFALLDRTKLNTSTFENPIVIQVRWSVIASVLNITSNISLQYHLVTVLGTDCVGETAPNITTIILTQSGSYNITKLLPWRKYRINITATSLTKNMTDFYQSDIDTPEQAPTGPVQNIQIISRQTNGATVTWKLPLCENRNGFLLHNKLYVYELPGHNLTINATTNSTEYQITTLRPFRQYNVSVVYVNNKGAGPSPTEVVIFNTTEDVPGPPTIISVTSTSSSITVLLQSPALANGVLVEFSVTISEDIDFNISLVMNQHVGVGTTITFLNLVEEKLYFVKARASTSVGPGAYSSVWNITTKKLTQPAPVNVTIDTSSRNKTCVAIVWTEPPITNETIYGYNISYHENTVLHEPKKIFSTAASSLICDLKPGTNYNITLTAFNPLRDSDPAIIVASTEQEDPPIPPVLEIFQITDTYIGVYLYPITGISSATYIYGYSVFAEDILSRKATAINSSSTTCPGLDEIPGTIVGNFSVAEIPRKLSFLIGGGLTNNGYENKALMKNHTYVLRLVLWSYFDGVCKYNLSTTKEIIAQSVAAAAMASSNNGWIAAIVVIVLVLIIGSVFLFLWCLRRKKQREEKYKFYMNEIDYCDLKENRRDDYDPQKYWNTVYSLRESRYIIAGKEFLPDDKSFCRESFGKYNASQILSFHDEFKRLPHGRLASCDIANQKTNKLKNRFSHLLPYDHSRVVLDQDSCDNSSDYINANYIKGFKNQRTYIAAQSPFDEVTVLDFWRMIFLYQVNVIVNLSDGFQADNFDKCPTHYWPVSGRVKYGKFILDVVNVHEYADYSVRAIRIQTTDSKDWQIVYIFCLTYWPEHGVPDNPIPLLEMMRKVNTYHNSTNNNPIVVHCVTGVSRSGVYIAIDSLLEQYALHGRVKVFSFVKKMRKDRPAMVRTVKQYIFIYEAIFEAMVAGNTLCSPGNLKKMYSFLGTKNPTNQHSYMHCQFKCLQEFTRKINPSACTSALLPVNFHKNRFIEIIPPDVYRPLLRTPRGLDKTDYINAVFVNGHRHKNHYVLTQTPLRTTVVDFWTLVYDHEIHTIVMLEPMLHCGDTAAGYWPDLLTETYGPFIVEIKDVLQQVNITIRNMTLTNTHFPHDRRVIRQFLFNSWSDSEFIPQSKSMFLDIIDLVNDWQFDNNRNTTPVLVHCKDGSTHCGLFVAVRVLCEKVLEEAQVDVFHTVKNMKLRRTQVVDLLDQYRFCYRALWDFINMRMPGDKLQYDQTITSLRSGSDIYA